MDGLKTDRNVEQFSGQAFPGFNLFRENFGRLYHPCSCSTGRMLADWPDKPVYAGSVLAIKLFTKLQGVVVPTIKHRMELIRQFECSLFIAALVLVILLEVTPAQMNQKFLIIR